MKNNILQTDFKIDELHSILSKYYSRKLFKNIKVDSQLELDYKEVGEGKNAHLEKIPKITFFYNNGGKNINLTEFELEKILFNYIKEKGYELETFKYIGGIRRVGYFIDEDTPYISGIRIYYKKKRILKRLKKQSD